MGLYVFWFILCLVFMGNENYSTTVYIKKSLKAKLNAISTLRAIEKWEFIETLADIEIRKLRKELGNKVVGNILDAEMRRGKKKGT